MQLIRRSVRAKALARPSLATNILSTTAVSLSAHRKRLAHSGNMRSALRANISSVEYPKWTAAFRLAARMRKV